MKTKLTLIAAFLLSTTLLASNNPLTVTGCTKSSHPVKARILLVDGIPSQTEVNLGTAFKKAAAKLEDGAFTSEEGFQTFSTYLSEAELASIRAIERPTVDTTTSCKQ